MLNATVVRAESGRYAAALVCVPGLWAGPVVWRRFAGYLAHRGWESHLVDVATVAGDVAARGAAVAEYAAARGVPAVVLGHDAGGLVALAAASAAAAVVLVAPLLPASAPARTLAARRGAVLPLVLGQPVPPPDLAAAGPLCGELPPPECAAIVGGLRPESAAVLRDVARGRFRPAPLGDVPALVVAGDRDPLLPPVSAALLARTIGAEQATIAGGGHWLLGGTAWQPTVDTVHRWIVRRLGESLLEFYAEAMADRAEDEDEGEDEG